MKNLLFYILSVVLLTNCNPTAIKNSADKKANNLVNESSPYLLQHAYNPVDWYPWNEEALAKAKSENKLIVISVGYAACHWCHVMEHESFEDSLVATTMNKDYVSIKVDREERPDVDDVYMTAAQLISGRGGWPLNAIALPDGRPIFAGTYYPKEQWLKILSHFAKEYEQNPEKLEETAAKLTEGIVESNNLPINDGAFDLSKNELAEIINVCLAEYDPEHGGRRGAPKFPMPNSYEFLMKYYWLTKDASVLKTITKGLDKMAEGGIYDHLGGGFARYSTDAYWLVPHFEKMLYDNGQLVSIYAQAYRLTQNPFYKQTVVETLEFIEREMTLEGNKFYSSLDADSEGEEGRFYIWNKSEIDSVLGDEQTSKIFCEYFDITKKGNWEEHNILNIVKSKSELVDKYDIELASLEQLISESKIKLLQHRASRERPGTDDKVLTSWNALMLTGYTEAYKALADAKYLDKAISSAQFLSSQQLDEDGRLFRNYKNGKSSINAFLDDYALLVQAFTDLYQVTFDKQWLDIAKRITDYCIEHFYNSDTKMFDYTSKLDPPLVAKKSEYSDNVIPSSNSAMARALKGLGTLLYDKAYIDISDQMLLNMLPQLKETRYLSFFSNWMQLVLDQIAPPFEIAVVGEEALSKRNELMTNYLGNSILLGTTAEENLSLLKEKYSEGVTRIFVCQNKVCKFPVEAAAEALTLAKH